MINLIFQPEMRKVNNFRLISAGSVGSMWGYSRKFTNISNVVVAMDCVRAEGCLFECEFNDEDNNG